MKKFITILLSALLFGLISGAVIIAVLRFSNELTSKKIIDQTIASQSIAIANQNIKEQAEYQKKKLEKEERLNNLNFNNGDVSELVTEVMPSVVAITNMQKFTQNGFSMFGFYSQPQTYEAPASGSGFIVGQTEDEIIVVTNNHVVQDSTSLTVTFLEEYSVDANIKGTDANKDIAVLAVSKKDFINKYKDDVENKDKDGKEKKDKDVKNDKKDSKKDKKGDKANIASSSTLSNEDYEILNKICEVKLGDSDQIKIGQPVVAIGNALGYGQTVTKGIISAKDRIISEMSDGLLQTDATINPGNSGGPLFNLQGEVIGINVAKSAGDAVEGMGYAIPINTAYDVIKTLREKKTRSDVPRDQQGYLGIMAKNIDQATAESFDMPEGVYVYKITEDSAAAKSSLKEKDIIVAFDDQSVKTFTDLTTLLSYTKAGEKIVLKVKRLEGGEYKEKDIEITLGNRPVEEEETSENKADNSNSNAEKGKEPKEGQGQQREDGGQFQFDPFQGFQDDMFKEFFGDGRFPW